jgi:hypothetical protein
MPQGALPTSTSNPAGGTKSSLNLVAGATQVIKASAGRVGRLAINTAGASASWNIWDTSSSAGATAANLIWSSAFGNTNVAAGTLTLIDWPCANGIVITVPPSGVASLSFQ